MTLLALALGGAAFGGTALAGTEVGGTDEGSAQEPRTAVERTVAQRRAIHERIWWLRALPSEREALLRRQPTFAEAVLAKRGGWLDPTYLPRLLASSRREAVEDDRELGRLRTWARDQVEVLSAELGYLDYWLATVGAFRVCPVPGATLIHDDFGEIVRLPKVKPHVHQGSDIEAPTGTEILAPFEGYASAGRSHLGGLEVRLRGSAGYVYNAHLSALGSLGYVQAGDTIGYVGSTGDSTAPHDHIEWRPWNAGPRDPYPLLVASCLPAS